MKKAIAASALVVLSMTTYGQGIYVPHGFMIGNAYEQMSPLERQRYLAGVMDGYLTAPMFAMKEVPRIVTLQRCVLVMQLNDRQLAAIVDKYMSENPEQWGQDMNILTFQAIRGACLKVDIPLD
jgi:uncharacterized membrane protein